MASASARRPAGRPRRRLEPLERGTRLSPKLLDQDRAKELAKQFGFRDGFDLHGELSWRMNAFDFIRERPPMRAGPRRELAAFIVRECGRILVGDHSRDKSLLELLQAGRGFPMPEPTDLMELRAETGVPFDLDEVREALGRAKEVLESPRRRRSVRPGEQNEGWLLSQVALVWREGTGKGHDAYFDPVSEKWVGEFLDFAEQVLPKAGVLAHGGLAAVRAAMGKRIWRAKRRGGFP